MTFRNLLLVILACSFGAACSDVDPFQGVEAETPTLFEAASVSPEQRAYGITFTPDMREAYFTSRARRGAPRIFVTRFEEDGWTAPEQVPFSDGGDESPSVAPDGTRLLFSSRRPLPVSGDRSNNIWEVLRTEDGWSSPRPIAGEVNAPEYETEEFTFGRELGPVLLRDGSLLYSAGTDPDWRTDIYIASPGSDGFEDPRPLLINSVGDEANPGMSADGRFLVFQGYRDAAGVGGQDLYLSRRTDRGWSEPVALPEPINSARSEGWPSFSPDGRFLFFASDRDARGGAYSIYFVRTAVVTDEG